MIPMVSVVEEMRWVHQTLQSLTRELKERDVPMGTVELGMMLEVPSAAYAIDQLADYADFFSIGSNDLAQYFLACDRGNDQLAHLYSNYHPSFIRFLNAITSEARKVNRWVGICGEMGGDPALLPLLVGLGIHEISMASPGILAAKAEVSKLDADLCKALLQKVMECRDVHQVKDVLQVFRCSNSPKPILDASSIVLGSEAISREEVIKELSGHMQVTGRTTDARGLEEAVWQREDVFSTGLGFGIAVPHCKSDAVEHNSISFMKLNQPVDWHAHDGQRVDMVFMLNIKASDAAANEHMKIFARLARKIMHEDFRNTLRAYQQPDALLDFLKEELELA